MWVAGSVALKVEKKVATTVSMMVAEWADLTVVRMAEHLAAE